MGDGHGLGPKVSTGETLHRLCRAVVELRRLEGGLQQAVPRADINLEPIAELWNAILDLCGVPADNSSDGDFEKPELFVRDYWTDILDEGLTADTAAEEFDAVIARVKRELEEVRRGEEAPSHGLRLVPPDAPDKRPN